MEKISSKPLVRFSLVALLFVLTVAFAAAIGEVGVLTYKAIVSKSGSHTVIRNAEQESFKMGLPGIKGDIGPVGLRGDVGPNESVGLAGSRGDVGLPGRKITSEDIDPNDPSLRAVREELKTLEIKMAVTLARQGDFDLKIPMGPVLLFFLLCD